jgi:hypothetical protein
VQEFARAYPARDAFWSHAKELSVKGQEGRVRPASVQRIWSGHGLKPRWSQALRRPSLEGKPVDVGLSWNPPEKALVLGEQQRISILARP